MNSPQTNQSSATSTRERTEQLIYRWSFLLEQGRSELHMKQWFIASDYYQQALMVAETLFVESQCRNCALRCYLRTLFEYAYIACKIHGTDSVEILEQAATLTLAGYAPMPGIDQILEPLNNLKYMNDVERELWVNQFFALDANCKQQLH